MKAIIIDDEAPARNLIKTFLLDYPEIEIIGEAADGFSGVKLINNLHPDLVFLDIKMPKLNGFELLELIENKPLIIFSTAFDDFAIQAFEKNAIDYLLKPFSKERFRKSIEKVREKWNSTHTKNQYAEEIIEFSKNAQGTLNRIAIKQNSKIVIVPSDEITHIEAQDDYVFIHTEKNRYLKHERMKYLEAHLDSSVFLRVHRSYIVNINFIDKIELYEKDSYQLTLTSKNTVKVSKSGYKLLKAKLGI